MHTQTHTRTSAQQLSVGFQNKGINHHYTHTHKQNTGGPVGGGWVHGVPAGLVKETHWHLSAAFTAADIATKVKWSKAVCAHGGG